MHKKNDTPLVRASEKTNKEVLKTLVYNRNRGKRYGLYRDWETDRKSTRLNSSHRSLSRMPSSA